MATLPELRAQYSALEIQIATQSLPLMQAYAALLADAVLVNKLNAIVTATAQLDAATIARAQAFAKVRTDLLTIANHEIERMQTITAPPAP